VQKFTTLTGVAAPLAEKNVNTDIIIPIKRLVGTLRGTLGEFAFEPWRYNKEGEDNQEFILNHDRYAGAKILIAGANFACGSSREGAVWALEEFGIRALMAPSFGAIFFNNCFQSGLLPIVLDELIIEDFMNQARESKMGPNFTIDLEEQTITAPDGKMVPFDTEPFRREALLAGLDDLGMTTQRISEIDAFQNEDRTVRPWVYNLTD
tara:strand:+ start:151 stop:774 length:624 start_codon:yes stop_codon:yes gene_type:complete